MTVPVTQGLIVPMVVSLTLPLALDGRTDVGAAYSFRRLRSAYTAALVRVRRSTDNVEMDFGAGLLSVNYADISTWLSGASGFVSKWYDQSGNGRDYAQPSASAQPAVGLLSNGLPGMTYNGTNNVLLSGHWGVNVNQPITFNICYRRVTAPTSTLGVVMDNLNSDLNMTFYMRSSSPLNENDIYAGTALLTDVATSMPVGTRGAVAGLFNGSSARVEVNAATVASFTGNSGGNTAPASSEDGWSLGATGDSTRWSNIEVQELTFFNTAHTQAQMQADNAANRTAWRF